MTDLLGLIAGNTDSASLEAISIYERTRYKWLDSQTLRFLPKLNALSAADLMGLADKVSAIPSISADRVASIGSLIDRLIQDVVKYPGNTFQEEPAIFEVHVHSIRTGGEGPNGKFTSFRCTKTATAPCLICDALPVCREKATHPDEIEFLSQIGVTKELVGRIISRGLTPASGLPDVWLAKLSVAVFDHIKQLQKSIGRDGKPIDITDPRWGVDMVINREGTGKMTKYKAMAAMYGSSAILTTNGVADDAAILELLLRARLECSIDKAYPILTGVEQLQLLRRVNIDGQQLLAGNLRGAFIQAQQQGGGGFGAPQLGGQQGGGFGAPQLGAPSSPYGAQASAAGMAQFNGKYDVTA